MHIYFIYINMMYLHSLLVGVVHVSVALLDHQACELQIGRKVEIKKKYGQHDGIALVMTEAMLENPIQLWQQKVQDKNYYQ